MRRTLFVVPLDLAPGRPPRRVARRGRDASARRCSSSSRTLPTDPSCPTTSRAGWPRSRPASSARSPSWARPPGAQLSQAEPRLRTAILPTTDKAYDVRRTVTTQVLTLMGAEGRLVRGRPLGTWASRQHTWEPAAARWPDGIPHARPGGGAGAAGRGVPPGVRAGDRGRRRVVDRLAARRHPQGAGGPRHRRRRRRAGAGRRHRPGRRTGADARRCCRRSTRRRWGGRSGTGSCPRTARRSTTATGNIGPDGLVGRRGRRGWAVREGREVATRLLVATAARRPAAAVRGGRERLETAARRGGRGRRPSRRPLET